MSPRRRELIEPSEDDRRQVRRDAAGRFVEDRVVEPGGEGAALRELHRRLVAIHHGLATGDVGDVARERRALERLDDALHFITEQPAYRAVRDAERRARTAGARRIPSTATGELAPADGGGMDALGTGSHGPET